MFSGGRASTETSGRAGVSLSPSASILSPATRHTQCTWPLSTNGADNAPGIAQPGPSPQGVPVAPGRREGRDVARALLIMHLDMGRVAEAMDNDTQQDSRLGGRGLRLGGTSCDAEIAIWRLISQSLGHDCGFPDTGSGRAARWAYRGRARRGSSTLAGERRS